MKRDTENLARSIEAAAAEPERHPPAELRRVFEELKAGLNDGSIRAAAKEGDRWVVATWVKKGILLGFRIGEMVELSDSVFPFFDKDTFPLKSLTPDSGVRIVPGGTAVRDGCYLGRGVTIMPPSTSTSAPGSERGRSSTRTSSSVRARRSAAASTSPRARRSAGCWSPWGSCRSSSRTTCSSAGTAGSTRAPWCGSGR